MELKMKDARLFWNDLVLKAISSITDEALAEKGALLIRHPGAKFVIEIIHDRHTPIVAGEATPHFCINAHLELEADRLRETIQ
jgi:hypothetical protein